MTQTENIKRKIAHGPTVHAIKRAKYEAKQERKRIQEQQQQRQKMNNSVPCADTTSSTEDWFDGRDEYAVRVTIDDVRQIRQLRQKANGCIESEYNTSIMAEEEKLRLERIASWIEPFLDLKEVPKQQISNGDGTAVKDRLFIAEGTEPVRLMIQKSTKSHDTSDTDLNTAEYEHTQLSPVKIVSMLCKPATFFDAPVCLVDELTKKQFLRHETSCPFKIIVGAEEVLSEIVGFPVARGAMACGVVPHFKQPFQWLKNKLLDDNKPDSDDAYTDKTSQTIKNVNSFISSTIPSNKPKRLLALDAISNTSNMGSILRTAAAFGIDAIILSDDSCDAWYRQSVRVSMGHVITVPTIRVSELREGLIFEDSTCGDGGLPGVLRWMRELNIKSFAAVVDHDSTNGDEELPPLVRLESLSGYDTSSSWICVLGNEGNGIRKDVVKEADYRIKISMPNDDVDSLSLPVAAGILIHGLGCI